MMIEMISGIYQIRNLINGKCYVGLSRNIPHRFAQHRCNRKRSRHLTISLAFRKYGIENFAFDVIERCSVERLFEREQYWIGILKPAYNRNGGGRGNPGFHSQATRQILREKGKAQWARMSPEQKRARIQRNLTGPGMGHPVSDESRAKMRLAHLGKSISESVRLTMGAAQRESWRLRPFRNAEHFLKRRKPVVQIDSETRLVVGHFPSIKTAASEVGVHSSSITKVVKRLRKTAGGFMWQLAA